MLPGRAEPTQVGRKKSHDENIEKEDTVIA